MTSCAEVRLPLLDDARDGAMAMNGDGLLLTNLVESVRLSDVM